MTARVRQRVPFTFTGSSDTVSFPRAVLPGNTVLLYAFNGSGALMTATFGGNAMVEDLETDFSGGGFWRYLVTALGLTDAVPSWTGSGTVNGVMIEVVGMLAPVALDHFNDFTATGETGATLHSCEYTNSGPRRFGFGIARQGDAVTYTGEDGAFAAGFPSDSSPECYFYKGGLDAGAGSINFSTSGAKTFQYALLTYEEVSRPYVLDVLAITWAAGDSPAAQDVEVPEGTTLVAAFWSFYVNSAGATVGSATLASASPNQSFALPVNTPDQPGTGVVAWKSVAAGTRSLQFTFTALPLEGPVTVVACVAESDGDWIDADAAHVNGAAQQTLTLDAVLAGLLLAMDQKYLAPFPSNEAGWNPLIEASNNVERALLRSLIPDATTETASTQDTNYSTIVAISLAPAAVGAVSRGRMLLGVG